MATADERSHRRRHSVYLDLSGRQLARQLSAGRAVGPGTRQPGSVDRGRVGVPPQVGPAPVVAAVAVPVLRARALELFGQVARAVGHIGLSVQDVCRFHGTTLRV
jgi:hypothetical protein